ncbi:NAD(P)-dependent alcohol dehydrogenase [Spirillospora sp. CA-253888]
MPTTTVAAVARPSAPSFRWETVTLDDPRPDEVLVRLVATGLCHTDLSVLAGRMPVPLPAVLGHEGAGVIEAVGEEVTDLAPGDRVVLTFDSCGRCADCRTGRPTRCAAYWPSNFGAARPDGSTPIRAEDGSPLGGRFFGQSSLARHAIVAARSVVRVEAADDHALALLAPIGCGIQTGAGAIFNVLRPGPGDQVAVLGAGAVGLSAVMAAALSAATQIVAVDKVPARLELARKLGATTTVDTGHEDIADRLKELTGGRGVTHLVETTGVPALLEQAADAVTVYGTIAVIGAPPAGSRASFNVHALIDGRAVQGVTEGSSDRVTFIPALAELFRQRRLPYDEFIRFYPADRLDQAVEDARSGRTIKPVISFERDPQ